MKTLWTTKAILDAISKKYAVHGKPLNNNQLSVRFNTTPTATLQWSRGAIMEKAEHIDRAGELLDDDPAWLALCLAVEREKSVILAERMRRLLLATPNRVAALLLVFSVQFAAYSGHLNAV